MELIALFVLCGTLIGGLIGVCATKNKIEYSDIHAVIDRFKLPLDGGHMSVETYNTLLDAIRSELCGGENDT